MAHTHRRMSVPADAVWSVLSDGRTYADWVVGTQEIRAVDVGFPATGTTLHYRVGFGPLHKDGDTTVLSVDAGRRLYLEAKAWPAGTAKIEITVVGTGDVCSVTIDERPARGIGRLLHSPVTDVAIDLRNRVQLHRLERLAADRAVTF